MKRGVEKKGEDAAKRGRKKSIANERTIQQNGSIPRTLKSPATEEPARTWVRE